MVAAVGHPEGAVAADSQAARGLEGRRVGTVAATGEVGLAEDAVGAGVGGAVRRVGEAQDTVVATISNPERVVVAHHRIARLIQRGCTHTDTGIGLATVEIRLPEDHLCRRTVRQACHTGEAHNAVIVAVNDKDLATRPGHGHTRGLAQRGA